jgi:hypothetical protein
MSSCYPTNLRCEQQSNPTCIGTATPRLAWCLASPGNDVDRCIRQVGYQVRVASDPELLTSGQPDLWDSGRIAGGDTRVAYAGAPLRSARRAWWRVGIWPSDAPDGRVRWSEPATFTIGILAPGDWTASWITAGWYDDAKPLPLFRRAVHVTKPVRRAIAFVCGLGHFDLRVNGTAVSEDLFAPGWTDYDKTCLYVGRDVTPLMRLGDNVVGVTLGTGMYRLTGKRYKKFKRAYGPLKLLCQLHLQYADGSEERVVSDASWATSAGAATFSCIYGGEDVDARLVPRGWDAPGFDASAWPPAELSDAPKGTLRADVAPPVRLMATFRPKSIVSIAPDVSVYDMGQNLSGFPSLTTNGTAGSTVKLITGELLDNAGRVTQKHTGSPVYFQHVSDGAGPRVWRPQFSYTGYRYIEAHGDVASITALESCFVHSAAAVVGQFRCSDPLLNRIHELILAAVRSNLQSVMTDCPHREKLGWLEQTHLMGPAVMMNFDVAGLYDKMCGDIRDAQLPDGCVPTIAPEYVTFKDKYADFSNSPEWGAAAVINPWLMYQQYGDRQVLADNVDVMRRYAAYLHGRENDGIVSFGLGDWYDIGPGDPGYCKLTSPGVTGTAISFLCNTILERTARVLNDPAAATDYAAHAARLKAAYHRKFFHADVGCYDRGSQTAQAMPLALGMVPEDVQPRVLAHLIADIRSRENHITAGDVGFRFVLDALADAGRSDVILDLLQRTDPPSYGCQLARGATTLTEAWDANRINSQNHLMLGHAELWFHRHLAGIRIDLSRPADEQIVIAPAVVGNITWAEASHWSVVGEIKVRWERAGDRLKLAVTVPANQTAVIHVPSTDGATESSRPVAGRDDVVVLNPALAAGRVRIGSGTYTFEFKI